MTLVGGILRNNGNGHFTIERIDDVRNIDAGLRRQLCDVGIGAFDKKTMTSQEVDEHVMASDILFVVRDSDGAAVGFAGLQKPSSKVPRSVALSAAAVLEEAQGNGIYKYLARDRILAGMQFGASLVETATQNPRVEVGIREAVAELFAEGKIDRCAMSRRHAKKHYGRMLTSTVPKSASAEINTEYEKLDYSAGDCYKLTFDIGR